MKENDKNDNRELDVLDELIENYYNQLLKHGDEKIKLGDLLKMIELKRKLSPEGSEQKKFWKMLNKIRKDNLQNKNNAVHAQKSQGENEK